jgi:hypothetical protein
MTRHWEIPTAPDERLYLFSVEHTARMLWSLDFESVARSGQKSIAQGLPWVDSPPKLALKGPPGTAKRFLAPSGRDVYFIPTQGKPWAKLFCPFGAGLRAA